MLSDDGTRTATFSGVPVQSAPKESAPIEPAPVESAQVNQPVAAVG
jgi:hypothetical protein